MTIWLTGMPCSGKTTISNYLQEEFKNRGHCFATLDGDDLREKLNSDLGFSEEDRAENLRRVGHLAQLFNDKGIPVICSFVSPTEKLRKIALEKIKISYLIYVDCPAEECARRDVKGMWELARKGVIKNFTGFSAPFEPPQKPDLTIRTKDLTIEESISKIIENYLFCYQI